MPKITEHHQNGIDWRAEAGALRSCLQETQARVAELEKENKKLICALNELLLRRGKRIVGEVLGVSDE